MPYLIFVTVLWAFSFSLIGQYLAGSVDSDFAVLMRVAIAAAVFIPFTRWRNLPWRLVGGLWLAGALLMGVVLAKLILVDRGNLGDAWGIGSFIAYGLLCTLVGYFAPAPPRSASEENAA